MTVKDCNGRDINLGDFVQVLIENMESGLYVVSNTIPEYRIDSYVISARVIIEGDNGMKYNVFHGFTRVIDIESPKEFRQVIPL